MLLLGRHQVQRLSNIRNSALSTKWSCYRLLNYIQKHLMIWSFDLMMFKPFWKTLKCASTDVRYFQLVCFVFLVIFWCITVLACICRVQGCCIVWDSGTSCWHCVQPIDAEFASLVGSSNCEEVKGQINCLAPSRIEILGFSKTKV